MQKIKALVMENHWLSEEEVNGGLALVQLYPGPIKELETLMARGLVEEEAVCLIIRAMIR